MTIVDLVLLLSKEISIIYSGPLFLKKIYIFLLTISYLIVIKIITDQFSTELMKYRNFYYFINFYLL